MIVLNGESGSGKTELSKYAIDFLVNVSPIHSSFRTKIRIVNIF